ncbi:MAG: ABC transporter ATP-binding protein [Solirubrobacterales bacterium]
MTAASGPEAGAPPTLLLRDLAHSYGDFIALAPLSLDFGAGELVALVGPNGAGKTTLLTMIAGLLEPTHGAVEVAGARAGTIAARAATSYLPDTPVFYDDLSLNEHLQYVAGLHGVRDEGGEASKLLERFDLEGWGDSFPSEFSRGMRQKASIALGLIRPFSVLLADEPFDGLDAPSRVGLFEILSETRAGGATVIVSTHRREVIEASSRCVALVDGTLAYDGPADADAVFELFDSA